MIKLTRKTITILMQSGQKQTVDAWSYNNLFAWHKNSVGKWSLVHIPTGYQIGIFEGKYGQIRLLTELLIALPLEWETDNPIIIMDKLDANSPYDAKGLISLLLSGLIDIAQVIELVNECSSIREIIISIDTIMESV